MVQQWIDNPLSNHGVVIANAAATDGFDFHSREAASAVTHPKLSVIIGDQTVDNAPI